MSIEEHRHYLSDVKRFTAYEAALRRLCAERPVVLDIGAGTGLLGLTALRLGARRVYGVERSTLVGWTRSIAALNSDAGAYVVLEGDSRELTIPEPVDLIVCDQLGGFILDGDAFPVLADAAARFLGPGGRVAPASVEFWVAPVEDAGVRGALGFWDAPRLGVDVSPLRGADASTVRWALVQPDAFVAEPQRLGELDLTSPRDAVDLTAHVEVVRPASINALAGWFLATLVDDVSFGTVPGDPDRIDRENILLPIDPPVAVEAGDRVSVRVRALLRSAILSWEIEAPAGRRRHSSWGGPAGAAVSRG